MSADTTWNPVVGCSKASPGCANCYAEKMARRLVGKAKANKRNGKKPDRTAHYLDVIGDNSKWNGKVKLVPEALIGPLRWRKPCRVFVNSMSDLFHEDVPFAFIDKVFAVMALCPQHTFQVLTKRPERMAEYGNGDGLVSDISGRSWRIREAGHAMSCVIGDDVNFALPFPNVWLGTSVENQVTADERISHLLRCPAAVRFLSCEPLLGPIDLSAVVIRCRIGDPQPDWVIVGGESGPGARPCKVEWIRSIVAQCRAVGVACFVKQLGSYVTGRLSSWPAGTRFQTKLDSNGVWRTNYVKLLASKGGDMSEWPEDLRVREYPR